MRARDICYKYALTAQQSYLYSEQLLNCVHGVRLVGNGRRQPQHNLRHMPILGGDGRVRSRRRDNSCWQSVLRCALLGGQTVPKRAGNGAPTTVSRALEQIYKTFAGVISQLLRSHTFIDRMSSYTAKTRGFFVAP